MHQVRLATTADAPTIADFNCSMALETEVLTLDFATVHAAVSCVIEDPKRGQYYVVGEVPQLAGSLLVTYEWSDWRNAWYWWIQSVYVAPLMRKHGVFRSLYGTVVAAARDAQACGVRLYMERNNEPARATYTRLGMNETHYTVFETELT
jgi:GNAT superfamily N-acetyltransferase